MNQAGWECWSDGGDGVWSDQQAEDQLDQAAQNTEQKQSDEDGHFPTPQEMGRLGIR